MRNMLEGSHLVLRARFLLGHTGGRLQGVEREGEGVLDLRRELCDHVIR